VVEKYGTVEEINRKAAEARALPNLKQRLQAINSPYLADLVWLEEQRDKGAFVPWPTTGASAWLGQPGRYTVFDDSRAGDAGGQLSGLLPLAGRRSQAAIANGELMPSRYIRVRNMKEQVADQGDTLAVAAAMQIVGASYVSNA